MRILITGGTGLVGQGVVHETLADGSVSHLALLSRRTSGRDEPRLRELIVPGLDALDAVEDALSPFDACFHCAGALPLGSSEARYRHVTHDLTLHVARSFARRNPQGRFLYISGAHADARSRIMPLRVKGETEAALQALPIRTVMLRPGGVQPVHGERSPHAAMRPFYAVAGPLMGFGVRLAPGLMTTTAAIGRALLALARMPEPPAVVENAQINRFATGMFTTGMPDRSREDG